MTMKKIALLIIITCLIKTVSAQTSAARVQPGKITKVLKFKPPVLHTFLGKNVQTALVPLDEANQLVNLPLKVTDNNKNIYSISSYQFMYKKKSVIKNEQTGKKEVVFTTVADLFKTTPLPDIWRKNIASTLQKQEELYFFDIIVKDKLDRKMFAPDVKIIIQ